MLFKSLHYLHGEHHEHKKYHLPNQQDYIVLSNRWWNISLYLVHYALATDKMSTNTNIKTYPCLCFVYTYYCITRWWFLYDMQVFNPHVDFLKLKYLIIYCKTSGLNFTPPTEVHVYKLLIFDIISLKLSGIGIDNKSRAQASNNKVFCYSFKSKRGCRSVLIKPPPSPYTCQGLTGIGRR